MSAILEVTWPNLIKGLCALGLGQKVSAKGSDICLLQELGLAECTDGTLSLTATGVTAFRHLKVLNDEESAHAMITQQLWNHPVPILIGQVFYGRGSITREQLWTLLVHHGFAGHDLKADSLGSFLGLLNKFRIIRYDKRRGALVVEPPPDKPEPPAYYFVDPSTPYSNMNNLRRILRTLTGTVFWIDKHFRKEGLEVLIDTADGQSVSTITIISGDQNITTSAIADYHAAKTELANRGVTLLWLVCTDAGFLAKWHDRWLVGDGCAYNIPPVLAIIRGQQAEMLRTPNRPEVSSFITVSTPVA